jgi:hypothetical protein
MLGELEQAERWDEVEAAVARVARLGDELKEPRPDVANVLSATLDAYFDSVRIGRLLAMHEAGGARRASAATVIGAVGVRLAAPLFERLRTAERHTLERSLTQLLCDYATVLAPGLVRYVGEGTVSATVEVLRVLGVAGAGYERAIASQLGHTDDTVVREALRALARIGTPAAAEAVGAVVRVGDGRSPGLAEEALWHFPPDRARAQVLDLLHHRDFVMSRPKVVARLLERAGRAGTPGLESTLAELRPFRFRFWNPSLRRVGVRAHALLQHP